MIVDVYFDLKKIGVTNVLQEHLELTSRRSSITATSNNNEFSKRTAEQKHTRRYSTVQY